MKQTDQLPGVTPLSLLRCWPRDRRLLALLSGQAAPGSDGADSRWSIFAEPDRTITGAVPGSLVAKQPRARDADEPPFDGGHIGYIGYDFARSLHPKAMTKADTDFDPADSTRWPPLEFHRCPAALCHDARTGAWWLTGDDAAAERLLRTALACVGDGGNLNALAASSVAGSPLAPRSGTGNAEIAEVAEVRREEKRSGQGRADLISADDLSSHQAIPPFPLPLPPSPSSCLPLRPSASSATSAFNAQDFDLNAPSSDLYPPAFHISPPKTTWSREGYIGAVLAAKEHIAKGDIYQLNLTHVLAARFSGSARALMATLHERTSAWFGVYLESPDYFATRRIMCCQSPELFLSMIPQADGTMLVQTRPMKGTRPLLADAAADSLATTDLDASEKENAELTMIIDLMRNDFGRVCVPGSVHVTDRRTIERHGRPGTGVLQATATVCGTLPAGGKVAEVLDATLPGGSITGAPKLRAMQLIAELEPHRRGLYCGVVGYFSNCGRVELAMAIRTALLRGPRPNPALGEQLSGEVDSFSPLAPAMLEYPVGAGIVADSVPEAEWEETLAKAKVLDGLVG